jgi:uncharacterized cupin superfamily protein
MMPLPMEMHPGVLVSKVDTDDWEPDPEVPGSDVHVLLSEGEGTEAGMTRITVDPGPIPWRPPKREIIHVLEGAVRIEIAGGPTLELAVGDIATLPAGTETIWHVTVPFNETWVLA